LKFDLKPAVEAPIVASLRMAIERDGAGPVLVCGSTVDGEEPIVLSAFAAVRERFHNALMILAPRHPERFASVEALLASSKLPYLRRTVWERHYPLPSGLRPGATKVGQPLRGSVFLLDTIGELASMYALADIAFVGGSLVAKGGHNILEAAQHGSATVVGPHTENFRDMVTLFRRAGALVVTTADELPKTFLELLGDDAARRQLGERAREVLRAQASATGLTVAALESLLAERNAPAAASKISSRMES